MDKDQLLALNRLARYYILKSTTAAGSGHPTSSLSAVELMVTLLFSGIFKYRLEDPDFINNDRLIFSKGHASPLFYALWALTGKVSEAELLRFRQFDSPLEGHPSMRFPYTEVATGSLGQGLSVGMGMALNAQYLDKLPYYTYVLLGDSEMAEGSVWEAIELAAYYHLHQLVGIVDVNRLGQRGETMYGYDVDAYQKRVSAFGWETIVIDGHNIEAVYDAYLKAQQVKDKPTMILAKTVKGKGVSFLEDQENWHGVTLDEAQLEKALVELGEVDQTLIGSIAQPALLDRPDFQATASNKTVYRKGDQIATRKAYGMALVDAFSNNPDMVVLDAEISNSTYAATFQKQYPERFFEMFIAEQNMIGVGLGLSKRGKIPFISTFSAFLTRAFDQLRMASYSMANLKLVGSHGGVSIGADGASQMGLEDLALFRSLLGSIVFYPCDAVSTQQLVSLMAQNEGLFYLRTTRPKTPVIYDHSEVFKVGGSKVLKQSDHDLVTVVGAGITVHEALAAYQALAQDGLSVRVIDLYSVKPLDETTLQEAANQTKAVLTVEDHFAQGGLGEAVMSALSQAQVPIYQLAVTKMPRSGKPEELLNYEEISADAIYNKVKEIVGSLSL